MFSISLNLMNNAFNYLRSALDVIVCNHIHYTIFSIYNYNNSTRFCIASYLKKKRDYPKALYIEENKT
jgi:hypothetical protein